MTVARELTELLYSLRYQGPPGIMHGGLVTTLADEVAAWAIIGLLGKFGFTALMKAKLLRPVRTGVEVEGRSRVVRDGKRVVEVAVELSQGGERAYEGEFTFALADRSGAERLLGGPLPAAWERFLAADRAFFESQGGDASIAARLPALYARAGLELVDITPTVKSGHPGSPVWNWLSAYFGSPECAMPTLPGTCLRLPISETPIGFPLPGPRPHQASRDMSRDCGSPICTRKFSSARWKRIPL